MRYIFSQKKNLHFFSQKKNLQHVRDLDFDMTWGGVGWGWGGGRNVQNIHQTEDESIRW